MRRRPCTVRVGDRCEVRRCKREVLITLILVLDIMPLAIIYTVACVYGKWLKVKCFISWPKLSGCIQGTYNSSSVYIFKNRAVVQSFRISVLFAIYIGLLVLGTSFIINQRYLSVSCAIYLYNTTQLQSGIYHRRQLQVQQLKLNLSSKIGKSISRLYFLS